MLTENPTPGMSVRFVFVRSIIFNLLLIFSQVVEDYADMRKIRIDIQGAAGTLYEGESFQLLFKFSDQYPFDSPQVNEKSFVESFCLHRYLTTLLPI